MVENKILIKRYQNRKLYDTQNSTYVTLDDIAKMIKSGDDVCILDNKSKEDLTAVTLAQIIFEEEKKKKSLLPLSVLKNIVSGGGHSIRELFDSAVETGVSQLNKVKTEANQVVDRIKDQLGTIDDEGNLIQGVLNRTQGFSKKIDEKIKSTVESVTHVTQLQSEIRNLRKKISLLEKKLMDYDK